MLKLPKVAFRTIEGIMQAYEKKKKPEQIVESVHSLIEEFASEQPALMALVAQFPDTGQAGYLATAAVVWKALKAQCECSELQSFMDVSEDKKKK